MPNKGTQSASENKENNLILDSRLKELIENKEAFLNGRLYSDLPYNQKIEVSRLNKKISELSWQCFEKAEKRKLYDDVVPYFVMAFELGWDKAVKLYLQALNGQTLLNPIRNTELSNSKNLTPYEYALRGIRYTLGLGVVPSPEKALHCFKRSALRGNILGQCGYGMALEYGNGTAKNTSEAGLWYEKASDNAKALSHSKKSHNLISTFEDFYNYIDICQFAAEQGNATAQFSLYMKHYKKKKEKAVYWARLAAEQGHVYSQLKLWEHYQLINRISLALYWFRLAYRPRSTFELEKLFNLGSIGEYTVAYLQSDFFKFSHLLLSYSELKQEFLDYELDAALSSEEGLKKIGAIIKSLTTDQHLEAQLPENSNFFITLLISLIKKAIFFDKQLLPIIKPLVKAIDYAEIPNDQIEQMMEAIYQIWCIDRSDYSGLMRLRSLWYRAQGMGHKVENKVLLRQIASMLISSVCNEEYVLSDLDFNPLQISLLFSYDKAKKNIGREQLNHLLESEVLVSRTPSVQFPGQLLYLERNKSASNAHQFFKRPNPIQEPQQQAINKETSSQHVTFSRKKSSKSREELAKIAYSDLTIEERFQLIKLNKEARKRSWKCFDAVQKKDPVLAARHFLTAFELNHFKARTLFKESRKNQSPACDKNKLPDATSEDYVLWGIRCVLGLGVPQNNELADFYFLQAAELGNSTGAYLLGCSYEEANKKKGSIYWYRNAAEKGHVHAQQKTGYALERTEGDEKNLTEAIRWYKLAAEGGDKGAQFYLGRAYKNGSGIERNEKEALRWLLMAYEPGAQNESGSQSDIQLAILGELKTFSSPLAKYITYSDCYHWRWKPDITKAVKLLLSESEIQSYFLNQELNHPNVNQNCIERLISSLISEAKTQSIDINIFLTELFLALNDKAAQSTHDNRQLFLIIKNNVLSAINFSQVRPSQIQRLIQSVIKQFKYHNDFELLKTLWYRTQSLQYQLEDQPLLRQLAALLLKALCTEAIAIKIAPVESFHIDLLFACLDANRYMSIEQLNEILDITILVSPDSPEAPVNLLNQLMKYVSDKERWSAFKSFFIAALEQYINFERPFLRSPNETEAVMILEGISQLSKDLKQQPQLVSFFNQSRPGLETLCNLLITLDTRGIVNYLGEGTKIHQPNYT